MSAPFFKAGRTPAPFFQDSRAVQPASATASLNFFQGAGQASGELAALVWATCIAVRC